MEVNVEQRVTALETEFRTELRHLATKEDLARLEARLTVRLFFGITVIVGAVAAIVRFLG